MKKMVSGFFLQNLPFGVNIYIFWSKSCTSTTFLPCKMTVSENKNGSCEKWMK